MIRRTGEAGPRNHFGSYEFSEDREPRDYRGMTLVRDQKDNLFWRIIEPPLALGGFFTTVTIAQKQIDDYLEQKALDEATKENGGSNPRNGH